MWGELVGGLISGAATYFGAEAQNDQQERNQWITTQQMKKAKEEFEASFQSLIDDILANPSGYAGTRTEAAPYIPTNLTDSLGDVLRANSQNFGGIQDLLRMTNRDTSRNDMERLNTFMPGGQEALQTGTQNALSMMRGEIPQDVMDQIFTSRAESGNSLGTPGGTGPMVAKDLGMTSLDLQQQGTSMFGNIVNMAEQISPINRQMAAGQFFFEPGAGASMNMQQALLDQQSRQNEFNLASAPDPALALSAQLRATQATTAAGIGTQQAVLSSQQPVMPYAQIYGQIGSTLGNAVSSAFGTNSVGLQNTGMYGSGYNSGYGGYQAPAAGSNPYQAHNDYAAYYNNAYPNEPPRAYAFPG